MNNETNYELPKKCVFGVFSKGMFDKLSEDECNKHMIDATKRILEEDIAHNDKKTYDVTAYFSVRDYMYNEVEQVMMNARCKRVNKVIQVEVCQA